MKRFLAGAVLLVVIAGGAGVADAKIVGITASPNPVVLGDRVRHTVEVGAYARLDVWISATGFQQPGAGTMPGGAWSYECCPSQTAGTPAWHFRSGGTVVPGSYRFGAVTRARGTFLSSALVVGTMATTWVRIT
jgi:hypothetical protein